MLLNRDHSILAVMDMQPTLLAAVAGAESVRDHCRWMLTLAKMCSVPACFTEQYPQKLGTTHPELSKAYPDARVLGKQCFSAVAAGILDQSLPDAAGQWVLVGIEAHVCVLQAAFELQAAGKQVFIVSDAVSSRTADDARLACERMARAGIQIVSREMVLFEWARTAGTPLFKALSQHFLQSPP